MTKRRGKKSIVIDFQWYRCGIHGVIPKELATCDTHFKRSHFVFKPVLSFDALTDEDKRVARYAGCYHGLRWEEGYICATEFEGIIKRLCADVNTVYVKGREKLEFLKRILENKRIVDLIDADKIRSEEPSCSFHVGDSVVCALTNVERLHKYLMCKVLRQNNFNINFNRFR